MKADTEKHSASFNPCPGADRGRRVALAAIRGDRTVAELRAEDAEGRKCRANPSLKREILTKLHAPGNPMSHRLAKWLDQAVELL